MKINIGNRDLKTITQLELYELLKIDGFMSNEGLKIDGELIQPWSNPVIKSIHWCDDDLWYYGYWIRKKDKQEAFFEGHFSIDDFIVTIDNKFSHRCYIQNIKIKTLNWLIEKGFNLPLSSYSN